MASWDEFWQTSASSMQPTQQFPPDAADAAPTATAVPAAVVATAPRPREIGGPTGPDPTRFGDWERKGRCIDF